MANAVTVNFVRLLNVCEKTASDEDSPRWRLKKYVENLQQNLEILLKASCNKEHPETLKDYQRRVTILKGILQAEGLNSPSEKLQAAQSLPAPKQDFIGNSRQMKNQSKEILLSSKAKFSAESRRALIGDTGDGLRRRQTEEKESDFEAVIQHHQQVQERLADDMVQLARNMKEHVSTAGSIVQDHNKRLKDADQLADKNFAKLKIESARLEEHTKTSSCWIYMMLLVVFLTFLWMIFFMKLYPKPKS